MYASHCTGRLLAGVLTFSLFAGACGSDVGPVVSDAAGQFDSTTAPLSNDVRTLSAADGEAARAAQALALGRGVGADDQLESASLAADSIGRCGGVYEPTAEDIATANAESAALAAVLDSFGVTYETFTDDFGFSSIQTDYKDVVAQSVVDSYWQHRYPSAEPEPVDPAELDRIVAENDVIAAALDAVGATYSRQSDESGWEWIEWDYENVDAQAAVEAAYAELYPPIPPTAEELATAKAETDKLAAAFDAGGIAYTRVSDEFGWEWIEWDYEDESVAQAVMSVYDELYPVEPCGEFLADDSVAPTADVLLEDTAVVSEMIDEPVLIEEEVFTDVEVAQRDADVAAMTAGFTAAAVDHEVIGESPWASVVFDIEHVAAVRVVTDILAARG